MPTKLPYPPAAYLPASSLIDEANERREPFSFKPTSPLPMIKSPARRKRSVVYSPNLGTLFIPALFILFWV